MKISFPFSKNLGNENSSFSPAGASQFSSSGRVRIPRIPNKKLVSFLTVAVVLVLAVIFIKSIMPSSGNTLAVATDKVKVQDAKASQTIERELQIPIKDNKGEELTRIKYLIQNAELRDEIVIKGKRGTAVAGRTFLILNIKLVNDYNKSIDINTKDFVRLTVGNSEEWLAPEIHNDPVNVQAISTKFTRIGFPVNEGEKNFKLQVGEITGEKSVIDLNF